MIPLRDLNPTRTRPWVTWTLIGLNAAIFVFQHVLLTPGFEAAFVHRWGLVPYYLTQERFLPSFVTPITSMFLHGGWLHLIGNMWFLHVFGDNVEDELGKPRFVLFYLLAGLAAAALQVAIDPASKVPMIGASGAIAGVLGAYVVLHPRARVLALVPIFMELPAYVFLFVWFGLQLLYGLSALGVGPEGGGVAFFAHIGGFVVGLALCRVLRRPLAEVAPSVEWRREGWRRPP